MATELHPLSSYDIEKVPNAFCMRFAVLVSEWNPEITGALMEECKSTLIKHGAFEENITVKTVPGSFELSTAAQWFADIDVFDAVICLGCVIQGETRHFEFICNAVANGLTQVGIESRKPVIFGVLTTQDQQQALDRAGGRLGNKGVEAAVTAIKMVHLKKQTAQFLPLSV